MCDANQHCLTWFFHLLQLLLHASTINLCKYSGVVALRQLGVVLSSPPPKLETAQAILVIRDG
eukprot:m.65085 g.65085  ORF g.65085 m.65085 type:complete len:63 (+) comp12045_c0_seq1:155-343(+)